MSSVQGACTHQLFLIIFTTTPGADAGFPYWGLEVGSAQEPRGWSRKTFEIWNVGDAILRGLRVHFRQYRQKGGFDQSDRLNPSHPQIRPSTNQKRAYCKSWTGLWTGLSFLLVFHFFGILVLCYYLHPSGDFLAINPWRGWSLIFGGKFAFKNELGVS